MRITEGQKCWPLLLQKKPGITVLWEMFPSVRTILNQDIDISNFWQISLLIVSLTFIRYRRNLLKTKFYYFKGIFLLSGHLAVAQWAVLNESTYWVFCLQHNYNKVSTVTSCGLFISWDDECISEMHPYYLLQRSDT